MKDPVDRGIRAIGRHNSYAPVWLQFGISHVVFLGGLGLIELYRPMSWNQFLVLAAVSQALVLLDNVISIKITKRIWRPVRVWERGARDTASTIEAWRAAATLPLEYTRRTLRRAPIVTAYLPFMAFATWKLGLPWYDFFVLATGVSRRQIHTISAEIDAALHRAGDKRLAIEGYEASKWVVQDYGDVVVHVFNPDTREYYALEDLWADAGRVDWERE